MNALLTRLHAAYLRQVRCWDLLLSQDVERPSLAESGVTGPSAAPVDPAVPGHPTPVEATPVEATPVETTPVDPASVDPGGRRRHPVASA